MGEGFDLRCFCAGLVLCVLAFNWSFYTLDFNVDTLLRIVVERGFKIHWNY